MQLDSEPSKHGQAVSPKGGRRPQLRENGGEGNGRTHPELALRHANRKSTIRSGRTIGEAREHLETKSERAAARKKDKLKNTFRIIFTTLGFALLAGILIALYFVFFSGGSNDDAEFYQSRMSEYIGQVEVDFRALGYTPVRAVLPAGAIREVDFYLEGYPGYIKLITDRGSAVSVEDADRMLRYLASIEATDFQYIDVRLDGKAYWK